MKTSIPPPKHQDSAVQSDVESGVLRTALNITVAESLSPVTLGLAILYGIFAVSHWLTLAPSVAPTMTLLAGVSMLLLFGLHAFLQRWRIPPHWAHPLGALIIGLVVFNSLAHLYLTGEPRQTTNLVLAVIGAGFLFLNGGWLGLIIFVALTGWGWVVVNAAASPDWVHFGFALLSGTLLSFLVHTVRVHTLRRLELLRIQDARRKAELEKVLKATEEAQRSLATSMAIGQRITSILDLDSLLQQVAVIIQERFGYSFVGIFLVDEGPDGQAGEYVVCRAGTGAGGRSLCGRQVRLKIGSEGIIGWVAAKRRPLRVNDVSQDERYHPYEDLADIRSELALPLEMGGKLLGVLDIESDQLNAFREEDVPFLQMLADQVAIAIQNASLYQAEKSRRHLTETLYDVAHALSGAPNLNEVLDLILKELAEIVHFDRAAVMLRSGEELEFAATRGFPIGFRNSTVSIRENDVFAVIYRSQQPLSIPDVLERPDWQQVAGLPQARAWLGLPLIHANQVIGMLSLVREKPDAYSHDEITLASTFAGQAAIALHNARLYDQITRFNQNLENLVRQRTEDLQKAYDQLERLDHTKSEFISISSHELRTPLTLIHGYTQMLLADADIQANPLHFQLINGINTGATRLTEIVDSLLDVAKIDNRELQIYPTPIPLPTLLRSVCEKLRSAIEKRRQTLREEYDGLPSIEADIEGLRKVFYNLLINAIKYTPDGGTITISGRTLAANELGMPAGGVEVIISDTGIGIDPSVRELIFTKFYQTGEVSLHSSGRTKFKGGGPGLGLAIAKGIVDAHGGLIWAESPGYDETTCPGSQFHVVLPVVH